MHQGPGRERARDVLRALRTNLQSGNLRKAQVAFGVAWAAEWAFTIALSVVAFEHGGAAAVGFVALLRMLPSALLAPVISAWADRLRRERVLIWSSISRGVFTGAAAVVLAADGPLAIVYGLAGLSTIVITPYRAAHSALLPSLCTTAEELTASNVVRGMLDSLSVLIGPLAAAGLLAWMSPAAVFAAAAAASAWSAVVLFTLRYEAPPRAVPAGRPRMIEDVTVGLRTVAADRRLAVLFVLAGVQTFTRGALTVLTVVVAIDLLGMGEAGVGVLTAAMGVGAVAGSVGASLLVGSHRLARWFGVSVAVWSAPLCAIGLLPEQSVALAALAVIGVANAVLDVSGFTIIPRMVADGVLARVYGLFEAIVALAIGLGAVLTPLLIAVVGLEASLVALGLVGPNAVVLAWTVLRRIDGEIEVRDAEIGLLREVSLLRLLPMPTIEALARHGENLLVPAGSAVCLQGEVGDRYYVIAEGDAEVLDGSRFVADLQRGDGFGEIALLRDVPRTTTVRARSALSLFAIARADFTPAVAGYSSAATEAGLVIEARLAEMYAPRG